MPQESESTVLVTGGAGLLGRRICDRLASDHRVVAVDVQEQPGDFAHGYVRMDLTDDDSVREGLRTVADRYGDAIASVTHLAAYYDFSGEPSPLYDALTVQGTRRLLEGLQELSVGQFVLSSSVLAMRPAPVGSLLDESSPEQAEWDYPQSKLDAERVIRESRGDIPAVVLRIAGCYDEGCHSIPVAQQIRRIYEKQLESLVFPGNAEHGQSFVHADDVASCVAATVARRRELGEYEVFLVGEPAWLSYEQLQDAIGEHLHGKEWPTIRIPGPLAKAGAWVKGKLGEGEFIKPWMIDLADAHYPIDIGKARRVLGWEPVHRLPATLPAMLERLQRDPRGWYEDNGLEPPEDLAVESGREEGRAS